jgi:hypothetical protein
MCVACIEYMKDKLNANEFRSALREMTVEDPEHAVAVAKIMEKYAGQPDEIKKALAALDA